MSEQIVVGFDGSVDARAALEWAIREAASRHLGVRVVNVEPDLAGWDAAAATMSGAPVLAMTLPQGNGSLLADALAEVHAAGVAGTTSSLEGSIAGGLVEASRDAAMVVLGSRGLGTLSSAVLGSTVSHVASHAHCPVIVAQHGGDPQGPVVVGVDGSAASEHCLGWAFDHASRHGLALEVLHAYTIPVYPGVVPYVPPVELTTATVNSERRLAAEVLAGWQERYPDVVVTTRLMHARPVTAMVEASGRASLTVVGSRGRGAFLGMLLGSTSQSLLHHAQGTVAVLRHRG